MTHPRVKAQVIGLVGEGGLSAARSCVILARMDKSPGQGTSYPVWITGGHWGVESYERPPRVVQKLTGFVVMMTLRFLGKVPCVDFYRVNALTDGRGPSMTDNGWEGMGHPMTRRRPDTVAKKRNDPERITLAPLTFAQAVRGLFSVKPPPGDVDTENREEGDDDGEDG